MIWTCKSQRCQLDPCGTGIKKAKQSFFPRAIVFPLHVRPHRIWICPHVRGNYVPMPPSGHKNSSEHRSAGVTGRKPGTSAMGNGIHVGSFDRLRRGTSPGLRRAKNIASRHGCSGPLPRNAIPCSCNRSRRSGIPVEVCTLRMAAARTLSVPVTFPKTLCQRPGCMLSNNPLWLRKT